MWRDFVLHNFWLKVLSVALATVIWSVLKSSKTDAAPFSDS